MVLRTWQKRGEVKICALAKKIMMTCNWNPRTQGHWPIALYLSFKFIGTIQESSPFTKGHDPTQPRIFYLFWIYPGTARGLHPYLFQHRAFTQNVYQPFFSAPHLLHEGGLCSPHVEQHALQTDLPVQGPNQHSAMLPIQFTYELNIPISRSLQTQQAAPIRFTDFPFFLFPLFNCHPYSVQMHANERRKIWKEF